MAVTPAAAKKVVEFGPSLAVTGANRGLGLQFVCELLASGSHHTVLALRLLLAHPLRSLLLAPLLLLLRRFAHSLLQAKARPLAPLRRSLHDSAKTSSPAAVKNVADWGPNPLVFAVTGANRGLGLQFVREILASGSQHTVLALVRTPGSAELASLGERVQQVQCDVGDEASVAQASKHIMMLVDRIDVLINNAGVIGPGIESFGDITKQGMLETFNVNVVGSVLVTQGLLPLLRKAEGLPKVAMLSSGLSSNVATRRMGKTLTSYACSKAAINMLVTQMAIGMKDIATVGLGPGWCETDLGKSVGTPPHKAEVTIPGCLNVLSGLTLEQSGKLINFDGNEVPY